MRPLETTLKAKGIAQLLVNPITAEVDLGAANFAGLPC